MNRKSFVEIFNIDLHWTTEIVFSNFRFSRLTSFQIQLILRSIYF